MLTPTTLLYKASKGYESTCNFIATEGELKRITSGDCSDSINQSSPVAPGFKNKTRYTPYVSPKSQISHIATNKGNINSQCLYITNLV